MIIITNQDNIENLHKKIYLALDPKINEEVKIQIYPRIKI